MAITQVTQRGVPMVPQVLVGGIHIGRLSRAQWVDEIVRCCGEVRSKSRLPAFFSSANGNVLSLYARSTRFRELLDMADAIDADGMPLVTATHWLTDTPVAERCATTDFFHDVARAAAERGLSFYLLGGQAEVNAAARARLLELYPRLKIVGGAHGYYEPEDEERLVAEIDALAPDVLWVGLGVPIEHEFVVRNRHRLTHVGVIKTCGGLYDYIAGRVRRAPEWMQRCSLEWLYRTWQEPGRLMKRYATTNVHAAWLMLTRTGTVSVKRPPGLGPLGPRQAADPQGD